MQGQKEGKENGNNRGKSRANKDKSKKITSVQSLYLYAFLWRTDNKHTNMLLIGPLNFSPLFHMLFPLTLFSSFRCLSTYLFLSLALSLSPFLALPLSLSLCLTLSRSWSRVFLSCLHLTVVTFSSLAPVKIT